jgi:hypothetical protein
MFSKKTNHKNNLTMRIKSFLAIILLTGFALSFSTTVHAQTGKRYNDYLVKETNPVILKYADPYFPEEQFVPGVKNDKMEEYAKLHPPITLYQNTGNETYDKSRCEQAQSQWLQQNPYYPMFIPYHIYNMELTPEDDVAFYEAAKAAWIKANPAKYTEIINAEK